MVAAIEPVPGNNGKIQKFNVAIAVQIACNGPVGTVVIVLWKNVGLSEYMYEIVPGFVSNCLTIFLINLNFIQKDKRVLEQFDEVIADIAGGKHP